jgi:hypothetical protein
LGRFQLTSAFVTVLATPHIGIATGLSLGVISYTVVHHGKFHEISLLPDPHRAFHLSYIYLPWLR